jgi:serine/threonine protein kinase/tetratricopeptide (TPR) repeat protein
MAISVGPFDLLEPLGRGGMGAVWKGVHREQSFPVALKVLSGENAHDERFRKEFQREVQAVAGLAHPGIVSVYDYGMIAESAASQSNDALVAGSPMLAMELADKGPLTNLNLIGDWPALRTLLLQLLDALGYAHARGMVHRDVKPTNILLSSAGNGQTRYKLTDFGIAHVLDPYSSATTQEHGIYRGSPDYSPPEQFEGAWRDYGPWTDLYALGCLAYEFSGGRPPFVGDSFVELAMSHIDETPPALEPRFALPAGFEDWVMRLLEKKPADRFRHCADAAWALIQLTSTQNLSRLSTPARRQLSTATDSVELSATTREIEKQNRELEPADLGSTQETGAHRQNNDQRIDQMPTLDFPNSADHARQADQRGHEPEAPALARLSLPEQAWSLPEQAWQRTGAHAESPPLPASWRRDSPTKPGTHLIGAGLNLFGLREIEFIGREAERDAIWKALEQVVSQDLVDKPSTRAVVIRGPAGTGKSRLAQWMSQRAHEVGAARVLSASHTPQSQPSESLRRMLETPLCGWGLNPSAIHERVCETIDTLFKLEASQEDAYLLDHTARGITEFLRPRPADADPIDGPIDGPPVSFRSKRERCAVLSRFVQALASERPLVIWLDDIPWATDALDLVEYMLESHHDVPVLFVMTACDKCLSQRPTMADRLEALSRKDTVTDIELGPLPSPNHAELIEHLLTLSPSLAWQVEERTAGNPLFAVQLVRDWVERGVLEPSAQGFALKPGTDAPLPDDLSALCQERIERFLAQRYPERTEEVRQLLEVGAALGAELVDIEWRTACKNLGLDIPENLVAQLVNHKLARRNHQIRNHQIRNHQIRDKHGWTFVHGALQETIERGAKQADRWSYHQHNCIIMLDELYGLESPGIGRRWGDHLFRAGEFDQALEPLLAAATQARQADDCPTGLEILDRIDTICSHLGLQEDVRQTRAWLQRAYLVRHYRHAHAPDDASNQRARRLTKRAMELARQHGWQRELGLARLEEARTLAHEGNFEDALTSFESAISIFEEHGMREEAVTTLLSMSTAQRHVGRFNEMRRSLQQARHLCEVHDDRHRALIHERYTQYYLDGPQQDLEQARVHATRFLAAAQDHLSPLNEAGAWSNFGEIKRAEGHFDDALDDYRRAYALASGVGAINLPCMCLHNIGITEFERGHLHAARRWFRDSRICMEKNNDELWMAIPIIGVAACEAKQGNWEAAESLFESATSRMEGRKTFVRDIAILAQALGESALEAERHVLARRALEFANLHWKVKEPGRIQS